jgi:uncharacterized protein
MEQTKRSELRRFPARGSHETALIHSILDAGFLAHIGFEVDGQPFVIPTLYGRDEDRLFLHGSSASRMLRKLETVVAFGVARKMMDTAQKTEALRVISEHVLAGRWADIRGPSASELEATTVLEFVIEEASSKIREGDPIDDEEDYDFQTWAGVVPLQLEAKAPIRDPRLSAHVEAPGYILHSRLR